MEPSEMNYFSDVLTVGLVLVLLFGSVALYLYTRIQQTEQKNSLLESILLDLKMNAEMKSYSELPADSEVDTFTVSSSAPKEEYKPFEEPLPIEKESHETQELEEVVVDSTEEVDYKSVIQDAVKEVIEFEKTEEESAYDLMTLKELQSLAKSRGLSGSSSMKKTALIEALKTSDRSSVVKPGLLPSSLSSMVDQSESLSHE
jgi:hypothetical protein